MRRWRQLQQQIRTGKIFGQAPFDELFILGMERDNDLWMRAHIGTRDCRKGSAPLGRRYFLSNWEVWGPPMKPVSKEESILPTSRNGLCSVAILLAVWSADFEEVTSTGIDFSTRTRRPAIRYLLETMSGGVALFDYDNDSDLDIFFTNGAGIDDPMPGNKPDKLGRKYWNRRYRNDGNWKFTDVTEKSGVETRWDRTSAGNTFITVVEGKSLSRKCH